MIKENHLTKLDIYQTRGFLIKAFDNRDNLINTRGWNIVHFTIYFRQLKVLQYFINELKINLRIAIDAPQSKDEFYEDRAFLDFLMNN